ncbi:MAG TPA: tail fiber domain-containing protein [Pyrinomonadaceae bacterium]|nr:tail fiber domain-containing protein [Pyrinomonadaceae bacterium]
MRNQKSFLLVIFAALILACLQTAALGQTANDQLANVTGGGSSVRWDVRAPNSGMSLTISFPDGRSFTREYKSGSSPEITLSDRQLEGLPDGAYGYELRLRPALSPSEREALKAARGKDDDPEAERAMRKRPALPVLVQSGSFAIMNGAIIVGGAVEGERSNAKSAEPNKSPGVVSGNTVTRLRNHRASLMPDFVIADDLIVQGSACVGLDCVNGESFSFDTIRLKENNTRISFNDTSVGSFPTNDWTIRANSSSSGGQSFLAFVDRGTSENGDEVGTIVFAVDAGAAANSLRVDSTSRVGLRTATPVLDLHIATSNTPAQRLEQTNAGGFTAQTWDIGGNEANFFVRDVTGGSRLPFRIRPGAPTSSVDIAASGNVGIGTASPTGKLTVLSSSDTNNQFIRLENTAAGGRNYGLVNGLTLPGNLSIFDFTASTSRILVDSSGNVGIGTTAPDLKLSVSGDADKSVGGGSWQFFSDERLKNIKGRFNSGLKAVMQLQPIRFQYKSDNALGLQSELEQVGFGAQALQKIIPEAVSKNANGYLMVNNDPILWTMLNAIKEQQKEIAELKGQVQKLRAASHRRRK